MTDHIYWHFSKPLLNLVGALQRSYKANIVRQVLALNFGRSQGNKPRFDIILP